MAATVQVKVKVDDSALNSLEGRINGLDGSTIRLGGGANVAAKGIQNLNKASSAAAKSTNSLLSNVGKFTQWYLIGGAVSGLTSSIKEAYGTIKEVDSELATVRKVTGESAEAIEKLGDAAYKTASKYGVAANQYLEAAGNFAKAGYDNYAELAELAIKTQLVGDVTAEQASKFLLASDAAFGFKGNVQQLGTVLDEANVIENNFATSIEKITEAFPIVASTASLANVSVEELMASIGTITAVTQETGTKAGTALRALFLNILGEVGAVVDEDLTVTQEGVDSMTAALKRYAPEVIEAAKATGKVIDPLEAISALSQAYNEGLLTEIELTEILTDVGGKLRTNQLASLVKNFDMYKEMLGMLGGEAIGSADAEMDVMLETWEAKSNQLKNTWTQLWNDIADSDAFKGALDTLREFLREVDQGITDTPDSYEQKVERFAELNKKIRENGGDGLSSLSFAEKNEWLWLDAQLKSIEREEEKVAEAAEKADKALAKSYENYKSHRLMDYYKQDAEVLQNYQNVLNDVFEGFSTELSTESQAQALYDLQEGLQAVTESYAEYAGYLQEFSDAGYELTERDQEFLDTYNATKEALSNWDETSIEAVSEFSGSLEEIPDTKEVTIDDNAAEAASRVQSVADAIASLHDKTVNIRVNVSGGGHLFTGFGGSFAEGTKNAPEGWALVNEVGAELISDNGRAYIANGGRPAIVHLNEGATVLTAEETKQALGNKPLKGYLNAYKNGTDFIKSVVSLFSSKPTTTTTATATPATNTSRETYGTPKVVSSPPTGATETYVSPNGTVYYTDGKNNYKVMGSNPTPYGGGGYGGGGSSEPAKPSYNYEDLEKTLKDELSDLNELAKWYDNKGEHSTEADTYQQAIDKIAELRDKYLEGGYEETAPEVVKLANDIFDYEEKKSKAEKHAYEDLEDTLDATLDTLDEQIELAENMGDINKAIDLQIQAQEAIAKAIDDAKALGYADDSQEILALMNKGYGYASDANRSKETLWGNLVDAIQAIKDTVDDANDLAERETAVEEARLAYEKAQSQRNVRIFNSATGQWEWIANQGQVSSAQKSYEDAQKSLKDAKVSQALSALKNGGNLSDILLSEGLSTLLAQGDASQTAAVATALGLLSGGVDKSASAETKGLFNTDSHDTVTQYTFNGVSISEAVAKSMTLADLAAQLSILNLTTQMPS